MYQLDPNTNTAIERQLDHVRAVNAYGSQRPTQQPASSPASLMVAVAAPIILLVVLGLMVH
jgi:hypothetical protein